MKKSITGLLLGGLMRRKREVFRACLTTFLALFFIGIMLLFQENMYQWQMLKNRLEFGDWFIMERYNQTNAFKDEKNLTDAVSAVCLASIYDKDFYDTKLFLGYMSDEFIEVGNIRLESGRMPENDNEIACDYNLLTKLGLEAELGSTITINYYKDDNRSNKDPERTVEYTLCGILNRYTDVWDIGNMIPAGIITESAANLIDAKGSQIYLYGINRNSGIDDYEKYFEELSEIPSKRIYYNTSVYNFKPWGPENIYNYIFVLIMLIGVSTLIYQIICYYQSRSRFYNRFSLLGATKFMVWKSRFMENILIILPAGFAGIIASIGVAKLVGYVLETRVELEFFNVTGEIIIKLLSVILVSLLVVEIVNLISTFFRVEYVTKEKHKVGRKINKTIKVKGKLNSKNFIFKFQKRLSGNVGFFGVIGMRIFSLMVTVVIIFCSINIYTAFDAYSANDQKDDICGFLQNSNDYLYYIPIASSFTRADYMNNLNDVNSFFIRNLEPLLNREDYVTSYIAYRENMKDKYSPDNIKLTYMRSQFVYNKYNKAGNSDIISGCEPGLLEKIENTDGVEAVALSTYETARSWWWDNMNYNRMSLSKLTNFNNPAVAGYSDTYLYSTEYVDVDDELYDRIKPYMDKSMFDYEAFKNGEQVLIFLGKMPSGKEDDSIKAGTTINMAYYPVPENSTALARGYDEDGNVKFKYFNEFIKKAEGKLYNYEKIDIEQKYFYYGYKDVDTSTSESYLKRQYDVEFTPCVSTTVAGVLTVDDEVIEKFGDIIPQFGYYTILASTKLGEKACESQNKMMEELLGEELSDDIRFTMKPNQISVKYDLSSSFSATDNIISTYFTANNGIYNSNAVKKEQYRTDALNALLMYGITIIAAMVINILVYSIVTKNRLEQRKKELLLLEKLGSTKGAVIKICMLEVLKESLWCIFTMPLQIVAQYFNCRMTVKKSWENM